jgi:hypothetical protein
MGTKARQRAHKRAIRAGTAALHRYSGNTGAHLASGESRRTKP